MSQVHVERVIGLLVTDEALRRRFISDPRGTLQELRGQGIELNDCERFALSRMDPAQLRRFADAIDARIQKADLSGGCE